MFRRLLLPAAVLLAACLGAPAPAAAIVHGTAAEQDAYPAQGYLSVDSDLNGGIDFACGGTLVGSRQFLTAAHCVVTSTGLPLPPASFSVRLGDVDLAATPRDALYHVATPPERHDDFVKATLRNDLAMLTLDRPANYELTRVVDDNEDPSWAAGTAARVIGWGQVAGGAPSDLLRQADVPIITDARCAAAYGALYDPQIMVCAAPDASTPPSEAQDICVGDGGGPLLVGDSTGFVLAGVASRDTGCGDPDQPGVYTRVGDNEDHNNEINEPDPGLNTWVHALTPEANFGFDHGPRANEPVTLTSTSHHPEGASYFTTFRWDFDADRRFDTEGKSVVHTFPTEGQQVVGIEASKPSGDKATAYFAFNVGPDPNVPPGSGEPGTTPPPPSAIAKPAPRLAAISAARRPKVRRGRFRVRISFARTAPRGTAVIEVFRGKRTIGIARTRVRRGATKRVNVKLTATGKRLLRRSATKRLKVRVRVRVGRRALRSKTLTIRR